MPPVVPSTRTFCDLYDDVLLEIFDHLDWSKHASDQRVSLRLVKPLLSLSRVNQHLRVLVGPRIFRTAHCHYHAWGAIPPLCNQPHIASCVQTLRLILLPRNGERKATQDPYQALWRALTSLPHLRTLIVAVTSAARPTISTALASCLEQTTTSLPTVHTIHLPCTAAPLLRLCPNASHLHFTCPHKYAHTHPPSLRVTHIYHDAAFNAGTLATLAAAYPHTTHLVVQQPPDVDVGSVYEPPTFLDREVVAALPKLLYVEERLVLIPQTRRCWRPCFEERTVRWKRRWERKGEWGKRVVYTEEWGDEVVLEEDDGGWMDVWWGAK